MDEQDEQAKEPRTAIKPRKWLER